MSQRQLSIEGLASRRLYAGGPDGGDKPRRSPINRRAIDIAVV